MKIYVATSWKNPHHDDLVKTLIGHDHQVYNFKRPAPGIPGFSWSQVRASWDDEYDIQEFAWRFPTSHACRLGYMQDLSGLVWCDVLVLRLPCGNSAHMEAGYVAGAGKPIIIYLDQEGFKPDLMYLMARHFVTNDAALLEVLKELSHADVSV